MLNIFDACFLLIVCDMVRFPPKLVTYRELSVAVTVRIRCYLFMGGMAHTWQMIGAYIAWGAILE